MVSTVILVRHFGFGQFKYILTEIGIISVKVHLIW